MSDDRSSGWLERPLRIEGLGLVGSPLDRADTLRRDEAARVRLRDDGRPLRVKDARHHV